MYHDFSQEGPLPANPSWRVAHCEFNTVDARIGQAEVRAYYPTQASFNCWEDATGPHLIVENCFVAPHPRFLPLRWRLKIAFRYLFTASRGRLVAIPDSRV
jgi:hypothetical protein